MKINIIWLLVALAVGAVLGAWGIKIVQTGHL